MGRLESLLSLKNGAMQNVHGIWKSVKDLWGYFVRSCGPRRVSSKSGSMNRSGLNGRKSLQLKLSGFRSVKLAIGDCGPILEQPLRQRSLSALSAIVGFAWLGRRIIYFTIAITIQRRVCSRQDCLSQCGEP